MTAFRFAATITALLALVPGAEARGRRMNCDSRVNEVMGDLNKLRLQNERVAELCQNSANDPLNFDTRYTRMPGGDCEQTYGVINRLGDQVEDRLEESCDAFVAAARCGGVAQSTDFDCSSGHFTQAGTKLREAERLLEMAKRILKKRVDHNDSDVTEYARRGGFNPADLLGAMPPNLTPDGRRYFQLAQEQAASMKHGMEFLKGAEPVQKKIDAYQAKLNQMGATTAQRAQNLGQTASTITGRTQQAAALAQAAQQAQVGQQQGAGAAAGPTAGRTFKDSDFLMKASDPVLTEDQFFDALEGKPLGVNLAANIPATSSEKVGIEAGKGEKSAGDAVGTPSDPVLTGAASVASEGEQNGFGGTVGGNGAKLASAAGSLPGGGGIQDVSGASSPQGKKARAGAAEETSADALANYNEANKNLKLMGRSGPSLRDLLKQKMGSGGGGATRAMHEVLGEMAAHPGEAETLTERGPASEGDETQPDIKGIDSEPLFVRVRAAHLRFQRVSVSEVSL